MSRRRLCDAGAAMIACAGREQNPANCSPRRQRVRRLLCWTRTRARARLDKCTNKFPDATTIEIGYPTRNVPSINAVEAGLIVILSRPVWMISSAEVEQRDRIPLTVHKIDSSNAAGGQVFQHFVTNHRSAYRRQGDQADGSHAPIVGQVARPRNGKKILPLHRSPSAMTSADLSAFP